MIVTAWNNGKFKETGTGYAIRIGKDNQDQYFNKNWTQVLIQINGEEVQISISNSFWNKCPELRNSEIGKWMIKNGYQKWPKGQPPRFSLTPIGKNKFQLTI